MRTVILLLTICLFSAKSLLGQDEPQDETQNEIQETPQAEPQVTPSPPPLANYQEPVPGEPFYRDVIILENGTVLRGTVIEEENEKGDLVFLQLARYYPTNISPNTIAKRYRETIYIEEIPVVKKPAKPGKAKQNFIPKDSAAAARRRHYIGVSIAGLIPQGGFASSNFDRQFNRSYPNSQLVFADMGYSIGLDATMMFSKKSAFGLAVTLQSQFNFIQKTMEQGYSSRYSSGSSMSSNGYRNSMLLGGFNMALPLDNTMTMFWDSRLMFGASMLSMDEPILLDQYPNPGNFPSQTITYSSPNLAFSYCFDTGLRFKLVDNFGFAIRMGYSKSQFDNVKTFLNGASVNNSSSLFPRNLTATMENIYLSVGVTHSYRLKK